MKTTAIITEMSDQFGQYLLSTDRILFIVTSTSQTLIL